MQRAVVPNVSTYFYYYQRHIGFQSMEIGLLTVISAASLSIGAMIYSLCLTKKEPRMLFAVGLVCTALNYGFMWMFTTNRTLGLPPFAFLAISSIISESFVNAF